MPPSSADVTVGLYVRNDLAGVRRSLPSVAGQTVASRIRLVVVDDASTDGTEQALNEVLRTDESVEIVRHSVPRGVAAARNQALDRAADGLITWLDAGEVWHPRRLERQLAVLEAPETESTALCVCPWRTIGPQPGDEHINVPDVSGDQLKAVLSGNLDPPAATLLGPAAALRDAGGFDGRMGPLQDRDLLTRLLSDGFRLIRTPTATPLSTRPLPGPAQPGLDVAVRQFRQRHAAAYRRYGRGFARQQQQALFLDAAAQFTQGGLPARALPLRLRALMLSATSWILRRSVLGRLVRRVRTTLPRVGGQQPPSTPGTATALREEPIDGAASWLEQAERCREADDLRSAQEILQRGLEDHPGDERLLAQLTEVLLLRGDWSGCAAAWDALPADPGPAVSDSTVGVAASAHRMLGDHHRALEIAEAGTRRWPRSHHVQRELYRARSALVDWGSCLHPSPSGPATRALEEPAGLVTDMGFLLGGTGGLTGHLDDTHLATGQTAVSLMVNGEAVVTTHARRDQRSPQARGGFTIDAHDLLEYIGDGDVLSVQSGARHLHLRGFGQRCVVITGYPSRATVLRKRLRSNWVFSKFGRLRRAPSREDKHDTLVFFAELSALIQPITGQPSFPFYGNLLGAIREHDFISHDVGGFDFGYVSAHLAPLEVRMEFLTVCRALLDHGLHLTVNPWGAMVRRRSTDARFLDLNFAWFTPDGHLQLSYGWRDEPATTPSRLRTPRECPLAGHLVRVPGNAEDVLTQIYGPGWVTPDQGFDLELELQRDPRFLLTRTELTALRSESPDRVVIESMLPPGGEASSPTN